jgi:hypothetical protein
MAPSMRSVVAFAAVNAVAAFSPSPSRVPKIAPQSAVRVFFNGLKTQHYLIFEAKF